MKICINDTKYKSLRRIQETILSICKKRKRRKYFKIYYNQRINYAENSRKK